MLRGNEKIRSMYSRINVINAGDTLVISNGTADKLELGPDEFF